MDRERQREIEIHEVFHKIGERAHATLEFCKLKVCNKQEAQGRGRQQAGKITWPELCAMPSAGTATATTASTAATAAAAISLRLQMTWLMRDKNGSQVE